MISHEYKFIFIHIPKCAGSSIKDHLFPNMNLHWREPNYEVLFGWCPKRKIHLQHATSKQLLEEGLISEEDWRNYFKFTFVRNPWDRAYSDYLWIINDSKVKGSFGQYMKATGPFKEIFTNRDNESYRGDHKIPQTDFFDFEGDYALDFVGRFETLEQDMELINNQLNISSEFAEHKKKNTFRKPHYSHFYGKTERKLVESFYKQDIARLEYSFENNKKGLQRLKDLF